MRLSRSETNFYSKMKFSQSLVFVVLLLVLSMTLAYSTEEVGKVGGVGKFAKLGNACLPTSCQSFGCCSGNCDYWCRACGIPVVC